MGWNYSGRSPVPSWDCKDLSPVAGDRRQADGDTETCRDVNHIGSLLRGRHENKVKRHRDGTKEKWGGQEQS